MVDIEISATSILSSVAVIDVVALVDVIAAPIIAAVDVIRVYACPFPAAPILAVKSCY